jgi:uncharacterized repeat protein (TIGR01451 family)
MTSNQGSTIMRNIPDVALTADNVFVVFGGGQNGLFGGTSCASPLWAGFMALVNQQAVASGKPTLGFINPSIYALAAGASYGTSFHDITTGDNTWFGSPNKFFAVTRYDLCTGWGTPTGTGLINALVGGAQTHISAPLPAYGTTLSTLIGGNPNGDWQLFIQDDLPLNSGVISNGWILTLTTANPVGASADLMLTMTNSAGTNQTVLAGGTLTYVITVTNFGSSVSTNPAVTDFLPDGITLTSTNPTIGSVIRNGSKLVWNIGTNLDLYAGAQLTFAGQINSAGAAVNQAIVASASTPDPNPDDDFAFNTVTVGIATPPQFGTVGFASGKFVLSITAPAAPTIVQTSTNLASTNWLNVFTSTPPFTYTNNATNPALFYRAKLAP